MPPNSIRTSPEPSLPDPPAGWREVRAGYPGALNKAYLDNACKGIPPAAVIEAVSRFSVEVRECEARSATADTLRFAAAADSAKAEIAALINAAPHEIALVESAQHGVNAVADALRLRRGDRVVTSDLEFFPTVLPWRLLGSAGVSLHAVPHREGRVDVADVEAAIDRRTVAVALSAVQEANGARLDLEGLGRMCRERDVLSIVDAAQHVGPAPLDVRRTGLDVVVVPGHKWLGSPFGVSFVYVREAVLERLRPRLQGYMTLLPPDGWESYLAKRDRSSLDELPLARDARKLEPGGTPSYPGAMALTAAIRVHRAIGPERIHARVAELTGLLLRGLGDLGLRSVTPAEAGSHAGIVTFSAGDDARDSELCEALLDAGVVVSRRYTAGVGGIRVSPYFYSDETDLERLLQVVNPRVGGRRSRPPADPHVSEGA